MRELLRIALPLTLWLASFSAIYGIEGVVCSVRYSGDANDGRLVLALAALAAVALQVALLAAARSSSYGSRSPFVRRVSVTLAAAALVAAVWTFIPVAATTICV